MSIRNIYDTAANLTSSNPTLAAGEIGFESDTSAMKLGDGATAWTALLYTVGKWQDYTPTLAGVTLSGGSVAGRWINMGKLVTMRVIYTWGTGDTFTGAYNPFTATLPVTAASGPLPAQFTAYIADFGTGMFPVLFGDNPGTTTTTAGCFPSGLWTPSTPDTQGLVNWSGTFPMTWVVGDQVSLFGSYEAA